MNSFDVFVSILFGTLVCELFGLSVSILQIRDFLYQRFKNGKDN